MYEYLLKLPYKFVPKITIFWEQNSYFTQGSRK